MQQAKVGVTSILMTDTMLFNQVALRQALLRIDNAALLAAHPLSTCRFVSAHDLDDVPAGPHQRPFAQVLAPGEHPF